MANLVTRTFPNVPAMDLFLKGGIQAGSQVKDKLVKGKLFGLDGLTLVFTTPSATVTFDDSGGAGLSLKDILVQAKADADALNFIF